MNTQIAPMAVTGVRHLVERAYRESGEHQYLRELLVNAIEAGAKRIEFGPEWSAVAHDGVYRLMVADDGCGMGREQLLKFLNTFGGGGKPIGDAHENYGVGAKTSLVPWNHRGVVVMSWTEDNPDGSLIWLMRDPATGEYGARKFETDTGEFDEVVEPFDEWIAVKPPWISTHGTVVVCLGNTGKEDTFLGKDGSGDVKGIAAYLNKRIWEVPSGVEVYVQELRSSKRSAWPRSLEDATTPVQDGQADRRWNRRQIRGARYFVTGGQPTSAATGMPGGTVQLSDGTEIDWYLWDGERAKVHSYAYAGGYIAALYRNELYDTQKHISHFRSFGITQGDVRTRLTLIARPPHTNGQYGVYPDTARNALKIQGTKRAGEPLPWADWASEFAQNMPAEIVEALAKAGPARSGTLTDSSWRHRLVDRFGARWKSLRFLAWAKGKERIIADDAPGGPGGRIPKIEKGNGVKGSSGGCTTTSPTDGVVGGQGRPRSAAKTDATGTTAAKEVSQRGGVPEYEWTTADQISESGEFAAAWCGPTKDRQHGLIQLARDFSAFLEVKKYWRDQYPDHLGAEVEATIEAVYGETMVARIAHSEALLSNPKWGRSRVDTELRTPAALTMSVLGLLCEDGLIASRLAGLGVRRKAG